MSIGTALVSLSFAMLAAGVAADAGAQQRKEGPCAADGKKFCSNVPAGEGRIYKCMMSHQAELAPACRDGMKALADKFDRLAKACKSDAEKYCKGIPPGDGRILSCLKGRQSDLDKACAAEFKRAGKDGTMAR
ncbi:MAG TPA: cysteine rich repeat-containing protein [Burkholderiales bacterium]